MNLFPVGDYDEVPALFDRAAYLKRTAPAATPVLAHRCPACARPVATATTCAACDEVGAAALALPT